MTVHIILYRFDNTQRDGPSLSLSLSLKKKVGIFGEPLQELATLTIDWKLDEIQNPPVRFGKEKNSLVVAANLFTVHPFVQLTAQSLCCLPLLAKLNFEETRKKLNILAREPN